MLANPSVVVDVLTAMTRALAGVAAISVHQVKLATAALANAKQGRVSAMASVSATMTRTLAGVTQTLAPLQRPPAET